MQGGGRVEDRVRDLALRRLFDAFAAAIGYSMWRGRADVLPLLCAVAVALPLQLQAPSGWTIVLAGLTGATVAYWRHVPGGSEPESGEPGNGA